MNDDSITFALRGLLCVLLVLWATLAAAALLLFLFWLVQDSFMINCCLWYLGVAGVIELCVLAGVVVAVACFAIENQG